ncbi:MAG: DMT family transporter [Steroidobacteraceae bacterium]
MYFGLYLMALLAGAGLIVQLGMNARLGAAFGNPIPAVFVNFAVGLVGLLAYLFVTRVPVPAREQLAGAPAWAWLGGLIGAFYVVAATIVGPRVGAVMLLSLTLTGQMLASLVIDHYGLLGFAAHPVTPLRLLGVAFLFAGVGLLFAR